MRADFWSNHCSRWLPQPPNIFKSDSFTDTVLEFGVVATEDHSQHFKKALYKAFTLNFGLLEKYLMIYWVDFNEHFRTVTGCYNKKGTKSVSSADFELTFCCSS